MIATVEYTGHDYNLYIEKDGEKVFTCFGLEEAPLIDIDSEYKMSLSFDLKVDSVTYTEK